MSGVGFVPQHTPRAVTAAPPSEETYPPVAAEPAVMELADEVVIAGSLAELPESFLQPVVYKSDAAITVTIGMIRYFWIFLFIKSINFQEHLQQLTYICSCLEPGYNTSKVINLSALIIIGCCSFAALPQFPLYRID
jgi:hypothetical protein